MFGCGKGYRICAATPAASSDFYYHYDLKPSQY
jgi:hypothetical protein